MSDLEAYVPDELQRKDLIRLLKRGVHQDEHSVALSLRGGSDGTRRVLANAIVSSIMTNHGVYTVQEVRYCSCWQWFSLLTSGHIYVSTSCHNEDCFRVIKKEGLSVMFIDCGRVQTETERLLADMNKLC